MKINNSRSDRSLSIEFSNHLQRLTEFVLTISDSRINLIIRLNFTGKSVAIFTEKVISGLIRAVAGQRSSPDLCFVTKSIKSTTKDIDLIVTQVGCDGTA